MSWLDKIEESIILSISDEIGKTKSLYLDNGCRLEYIKQDLRKNEPEFFTYYDNDEIIKSSLATVEVLH